MKRNATRLRGLAALLLALAMVLSLAACGGARFDASAYVDACIKMMTTGDSEALEAFEGKAVVESADDFQKEITSAIEGQVGASDLGEASDKIKPQFIELVKKLVGSISYSVGDATELTEGSTEGYEVPLTIKPLKINIKDDLNKWLQDFQTNTAPEKMMEMDMDELYELIFNKEADLMNSAIEKKEYGEEKTFNIPVTKNKDGLYEMDKDALQKAVGGSFSTDIGDALS